MLDEQTKAKLKQLASRALRIQKQLDAFDADISAVIDPLTKTPDVCNELVSLLPKTLATSFYRSELQVLAKKAT